MSNQHIIKHIVSMLNMSDNLSFSAMKAFLRKTGLCTYLLHRAGEEYEYSLLSREEVMGSKRNGLTTPCQLNYLLSAIRPMPEAMKGSILGQARLELAKRVVFPEDQDAMGAQLAVRAFLGIVAWFRVFMAGCANGNMDVDTLNKYKHVKGVVLEFRPFKNSMNPALSVAELHDTGDDIIERKVLSNFIYPFIFSGQGNELAKVRKCRQCGTWFSGERLSATFCGGKCRSAFHHASR